MEITRTALIRFLTNRCSAAEAEAIYVYLQQHPDVLDELLSDDEWLDFRHEDLLDKDASEKLLALINREKQPRVRQLKPVYWRIAAAVVLLLAGWWAVTRLTGKEAAVKPQLAVVPVQQPAVEKDTVLLNRSKQNVKYVLDDGSVVVVRPQSAITLCQPFGSDNRNIRLSGEALFTVVKDTHRPFTVFTPGFSTTALGTVFRIEAREGSSTSSVKLIQGKVLVKNLKHAQEQRFLLAGESCVFNNHSFSLTKIKPAAAVNRKDSVAEGQALRSEQELVFTNMPLPDIMKILAEHYHTSIECTNAALARRKFTGRFSREETLDGILQTIAALNELQVIKNGSAYYITP